METAHVSDDEIVAQTVRYARSAGSDRKGKDILALLQADFPAEDEARIKRCMSTAADLLLAQHSD